MLTSDNEFQYFNTYQKLSQEGKVYPLSCTCGGRLITVARKGALALWCPMEDSFTVPGFLIRMRVESYVDQFYEGAL